MYRVKPIGLNLKDTDRDVPDGSLQESINMQWRDGAFKPIPERIISQINASGYTNIILHKVGDENTINVLGFNATPGSETFLAYDLAAYLGGEVIGGFILEWFGTITDGVYASRTITQINFVMTPGMSFTILNGLAYFMGDGTVLEEQYFVRLEFDEATQTYKTRDLYAWKSLIPFFPFQNEILLKAPKNTYNAFSQCGLVLIRFALVLKSGEVVLHSPIYGYLLYGLNRSNAAFSKGDAIENIHSFINLNLSFADMQLFNDEISAINIYATTPDYESKFLQGYSDPYNIAYLIKSSSIKGQLGKKAEEPFYLIKTINAPTSVEKILLTIGSFDTDIVLPNEETFTYSRIDITSIAAGEIMPVDNFSYHKLYGKITAYNGRLVVRRPVTLLSGGHMRALSTIIYDSDQAFSIVTEDGEFDGISYAIDAAVEYSGSTVFTRGILSYPDARASRVGSNNITGADIRLFKCRKNVSHNMSCNFDILSAGEKAISFVVDPADGNKLNSVTDYCVYITYDNGVYDESQRTVVYDVPTEELGPTSFVFYVPDEIDLNFIPSARTKKYIPELGENVPSDPSYPDEFTFDNGGPGGVGRFTFVVAPVEFLTLAYIPADSTVQPDVEVVTPSISDANTKYSSDNRIQFSLVGEYKVWPAINSYRVGEGKVMNLGTGSVNPTESQVISPIIIGTTDGVYTVNLDPMGNNFIASITKSKNIPFISEEILEIDNNILFVSDQGLMVYSNGDIQNLTIDFFPQQGNGDFPIQNNIFAGYDLLTEDFFGENGNPYEIDDIVRYMRGVIMAYDSRRRNIWCSNPAYNFSLVFNLDVRQWSMSTLVFDEKQEVFSIVNTTQGDIYTRYMVKKAGTNNLMILSGEDLTQEVFYHILTRPIKFQNVDDYKLISRMIFRTFIKRSSAAAYVSAGLWGQQEVSKYKKSIPIAVKKDDREEVFPDNMRYHILIDCRKGKYKAVTILQSGKALPESYISSFDFDVYEVDNKKMR